MASSSSFQYIVLAKQLAREGLYDKALDLYLSALETNSELKNAIAIDFRRILNAYNEQLYKENKISAIFDNFGKSILHFPNNRFITNDIGTHLYKIGHLHEASGYFQNSLNIDPGFVLAEKNLNSVKNAMIERWHYRMLNDRTRNTAYKEALKQILKPDDSVLDIGCGTGILSLYAHEMRPKNITAIESSQYMSEIANHVFNDNNANIKIAKKFSTNCSLEDIDYKHSVLVTEVFDAGLLGEHILHTLEHALENLLIDNPKVIPARAEIFVVGVQSENLKKNYRVSNSKCLEILGISDEIYLLNNEPYDSDDLSLINDVKYITEVTSVIKVNFNSIDDVKEKLHKNITYIVNLIGKANGQIDALASWFNLHLTDSIAVTTNPESLNKCYAWQQAVFTNFHSTPINKGETINFGLTCHNGKLELINESIHDKLYISREMLRFLNDTEYINLISNSIAAVCIYLGQTINVSQCILLDLNPFPLFGLLMMKRGAQHLTCCARTTEDRKFIEHVFQKNEIDLSKLYFLNPELNLAELNTRKYHVIYVNLIDLSGDLNLRQMDILRTLKISCLNRGGILLPQSVSLYGCLVSCDQLETNNILDDCNIGNYNISKYLNRYQVSQNFHLDITRLDYKTISEVIKIADINESMTSQVLNVEIIDEGEVNALLCWYCIQLMENNDFICTDRVNSYVDSTIFLANPRVRMCKNNVGNILLCVDTDKLFKLIIDVD